MAGEIVEAFDKLRRDEPDRPLIYLPAANAVITAADLGKEAACLASAVDIVRIDAGQLVISVVGNVPLALSLLLACRARSLSLMALESNTTAVEILDIADRFGAGAVVTAKPLASNRYRTSRLAESAWLHLPVSRAQKVFYPDVAVLKFTSGSTGRPRATLTTESALVSDGRTLAQAMDIRPDDVQIAAISLSHSYGLGNLVMPLLLQGTAISMRKAFVPQRLLDDAHQLGARHFPGAPYMFDHLATHLPRDAWPSSLTCLVSAGAPLRVDVARRFHAKFGVKVHSFYGTSETGGIAFDAGAAPAGEGQVGTALPGVEITLVPCDGDPAPQGRLFVRSAALSRGYAGEDDSDAFVDGGFLTSDLGAIDRHGQLTLSGRVSTLVNVAGRKVQPEEVERVLREFPCVADARVVGLDDALRGERLVAVVVVTGTPPTTLELRMFCASRLAAHKIPRLFVTADAIPLTARGKTDRSRLLAIARAGADSTGMLYSPRKSDGGEDDW